MERYHLFKLIEHKMRSLITILHVAAVLLHQQLVQAAITNYGVGATFHVGANIELEDDDTSILQDGQCWPEVYFDGDIPVGSYWHWYLDFGTSITSETIVVWGDHGFYDDDTGEDYETTGDFYIGESATYNIDSTLCASGVYMNGIVNCRGTGRYLHLVRYFPTVADCYQYIGGDLIVTPEKEIGQYCTSCSYGDAVI